MSRWLCLGLGFVLLPSILACESVDDCSLGGDCVQGSCVCDSTWTGSKCSVLNLANGSLDNGCALCNSTTDSWGGSVRYDSQTGNYVMTAAIMLNQCGLNSWECNSAIGVATASSAAGPFQLQETLLAPFGHNPTLHKWTNVSNPNQFRYIVYHIGQGVPHDGSPQLACANGTTPSSMQCGSMSLQSSWKTEPKPGDNLGNPNMLVADSLSGPWRSLNASGGSWAFNNPGVLQLKNGSTLIVHKLSCQTSTPGFCRQFAVAMSSSPSWTADFIFLRRIEVYGEDAYPWVDKHGNFHMLFQGGNYAGCGAACNYTGHFHTAWSSDGLEWQVERDVPAFTESIPLNNGESITLERRERCQLLFNDQGLPTHLYNGGTRQDMGDECHTYVQEINTSG
eukprot:TRINITY_DN11938_c6_g1_i12.p1 TRINITY_DN11938_c6_g1~~TRINITY_DN11938_c6_g1_i12.p1  ORF type:complete len:394 (+),score=50.30 TRINITY_DN11938_c6_g1_i12:2-1183(+)